MKTGGRSAARPLSTAAEMTRIYFEEMGYRVLFASSAAAALAMAESEAPDVLLTDLLLPGIESGLNVARQLRKNHPALPIFITSGLPEDAIRAAARTITATPHARAHAP